MRIFQVERTEASLSNLDTYFQDNSYVQVRGHVKNEHLGDKVRLGGQGAKIKVAIIMIYNSVENLIFLRAIKKTFFPV